jgi:hypothetical protein
LRRTFGSRGTFAIHSWSFLIKGIRSWLSLLRSNLRIIGRSEIRVLTALRSSFFGRLSNLRTILRTILLALLLLLLLLPLLLLLLLLLLKTLRRIERNKWRVVAHILLALFNVGRRRLRPAGSYWSGSAGEDESR